MSQCLGRFEQVTSGDDCRCRPAADNSQVASKLLPQEVAVCSTPYSVLQQIASLTWLIRKVTVLSLGVVFPLGTLNWHDQNSVCCAAVGPQD